MMRTIAYALLAALMLTPVALAQDEAPPEEKPQERPDDAAWTEDCPPDMMCAYGGGGEGEPKDEPTYPSDCGGEVCAYGDEDCIECSGPVDDAPKDDGASCMDGQQENETCRDDVQYLDGRGPADCENCRGGTTDEEPVVADPVGAPIESHNDAKTTEVSDTGAKSVPAPALALVIIGVGWAAVMFVSRK